MHRRMSFALASVALLTFGAAACSDEDQDDLGDTLDSIVDEAEDDARTAISDAEDAGRTAISEAEDALDEAGGDAAELIARNIAAEQGEEQFSEAGYPIDGDGLTCEATVTDGLDGVEVDCSGTTEDGGAAELTGSTSQVPGASAVELEGSFSGTVDGAEVFTADRLGG